MKPLQTHGLFEERWIPPKERFVVYEKSDEEWCRFFGIGEVVQEPVQLFDVRDGNTELVGYTNRNPAIEIEKYGKWKIALPIISRSRICMFGEGNPVDGWNGIREVFVYIRRFSYMRESFLAWQCCIHDAEALLRAGWIKCIGEDNIEQLAYEIRKRSDRAMFDMVQYSGVQRNVSDG